MAGEAGARSGWQTLFSRLGINPSDALRRARLPVALFSADEPTVLPGADYFRLWRVLDEHVAATFPALALQIGTTASEDPCSPARLVGRCSADLNAALGRIAQYRRLVAPIALRVLHEADTTTVYLEWVDASCEAPESLCTAELVFIVELARAATGLRIEPLQVGTPRPPARQAEYKAYLGTPISTSAAHCVVFSAGDAARPFRPPGESIWSPFEPALRPRPAVLAGRGSMGEHVRDALLRLLPAGESSVQAVARALETSVRTLQRRLQEEGHAFQKVLSEVRESLARHYLTRTRLQGAEIAFLLAFEDPNSFVRAFHGWTGTTPQRIRAAAR